MEPVRWRKTENNRLVYQGRTDVYHMLGTLETVSAQVWGKMFVAIWKQLIAITTFKFYKNMFIKCSFSVNKHTDITVQARAHTHTTKWSLVFLTYVIIVFRNPAKCFLYVTKPYLFLALNIIKHFPFNKFLLVDPLTFLSEVYRPNKKSQTTNIIFAIRSGLVTLSSHFLSPRSCELPCRRFWTISWFYFHCCVIIGSMTMTKHICK